MGVEEEGKGGIDLAGYFAKVKLRELEQKQINDRIEGMDKKILELNENIKKVVLGVDGIGKAKQGIGSFSLQQHWNEIKKAPHGYEDMDTIFSDRFAENPEFRKKSLAKLSDKKVVEMKKSGELDGILTGVCKDDSCRADLIVRLKAAEKGKEKKLL